MSQIEPYYQDENTMLFHCRNENLARIILPKYQAPSLILTSPPYDKHRTYGDSPEITHSRVVQLIQDMDYIIAEGGVILWNVNDQIKNGGASLNSFRQAIAFQEEGFRVYPMFWDKGFSPFPNPNIPPDSKEYIFVCHKGNFTFNPLVDVPTSGHSNAFGKNTKRQKDGTFKELRQDRPESKDFRPRTNVWKGKTAAQERPCQKLYGDAPMPQWLARDLIFCFSNPGDLVLDPYHGGGTTWIESLELGRKYIGIESNLSILEESIERMNEWKQKKLKNADIVKDTQGKQVGCVN